MKWKELERLAVKNGWKFFKHGTNHDAYKKGKKVIWLERHWSQEVKIGLCIKLLKQINNG